PSRISCCALIYHCPRTHFIFPLSLHDALPIYCVGGVVDAEREKPHIEMLQIGRKLCLWFQTEEMNVCWHRRMRMLVVSDHDQRRPGERLADLTQRSPIEPVAV